jgi:hypothetical protein
MPWLMSDTHLDRHDKLIHFRRRMRWSKNESVGFLHRFWWAVLQYAPNGDVATLPAEVLAETARDGFRFDRSRARRDGGRERSSPH